GVFRPQMLARSWFSRKYYSSPMPYSIFYHKGYAIHGTNYLSRLGGPASHGCVRLHPANAAVLFSLVQRYRSATRIIVS
ncbi:MAG TPA: L,D-transpeptidase, partial [Xanthobacteraceae bacterium]